MTPERLLELKRLATAAIESPIPTQADRAVLELVAEVECLWGFNEVLLWLRKMYAEGSPPKTSKSRTEALENARSLRAKGVDALPYWERTGSQ